MNKKIRMIVTVLLSIVTLIITTHNFKVQAATTGEITFKANSTSVKAGDAFTITVHIKSSVGINGMGANYKYNTDVLELQSAKVAGEGWSSLSGENEIAIIRADEKDVTEADVFVLTFKVKDNVKVGTKIDFNVTDIYLSTFNDDINLSNQTVNLTVVKQEENVDNKDNTGNNKDNVDNKDNTDNKDNVDNKDNIDNKDNTDNTDNKDNIDNKDNTDNKDNADNKDNIDNTAENNGKDETNNKDITITVSNDKDNNSKNITSSNDEKYPKAGVCTISIIVVAVIFLISFISYKKYNNIQIK